MPLAKSRCPPGGLVLIGLVCLALCRRAVPVIAQVAGPATLSLEGQGGLATPGSRTTFTLRLLNWTDRPVSGGVISDTLPAGITYVPGSTRATTGGDTLSTADPVAIGSTLAWGPFRVPAAGHTAHTPRGIHTAVQDLCLPEFIDIQLDQALALAAGTPAVPLRQRFCAGGRRGRPAMGGRGQPPGWHCAGRLPPGRRPVA